MRRPLLSSTALALFALAAPAQAEPLAPRLVCVLDIPGRVHALADRGGRVAVTATLPPGADAASLGLLRVAPGIGAARLAPDEVAPFAAAHPELSLSITPRLKPLLDVAGKWTNVSNFRTTTGLDGSGVVVGVVDTGIDVMHPDFRTKEGKTRIAWLLAGGPPKGLHPEIEARFGCTDGKNASCAVYSAADIDAMIEAGAPDVRDVEGHGTHVTSIAAGNGGPMVAEKPRFVGVAPGATLIVAAPGDQGGFFDADILNATRFVFACADSIEDCDDTKSPEAYTHKIPAVVNLSLGGDYGSHDGQSNLEKGLSALVGDDKPGRAIVVAAGNSGALYDLGDGKGPYGIHTEVHVAPHEVTRVPIAAGAAKDAQAFVWITFRPGDDVEVALEGPGGSRWIGFTGKGDDNAYADGSGTDAVKAGVINNLPNSRTSITAETNSAVVVWTGRWPEAEFAVLMRGSGDASLWITGTGEAAENLFFARSMRQGTINVPASAPGLLAVGCTLNRVTWTPLSGHAIQLTSLGPDEKPVADGACYFSAGGPTPFGVQKPEISAPGGFIAAAMSAEADPRLHSSALFLLNGCPEDDPFCALMDERHGLVAGTSMSAPHVAGAIALLMGLDPTLTQARATLALQAGARRPTGLQPDPQQLGPGELDLSGARLALLDEMQAPADPDLSRSWYTLSSAYARPDPTWPVWGTVELRKADGTPAGAIDGTKLALRVDGGSLYQPLARVKQGMWRFAVTGKEGDLGGTVRVDVTYAGVSLGASTLPVGLDRWTSNDHALGATSGACASTARSAGGAGALAAALGLAAAALGVRRRRRRER